MIEINEDGKIKIPQIIDCALVRLESASGEAMTLPYEAGQMLDAKAGDVIQFRTGGNQVMYELACVEPTPPASADDKWQPNGSARLLPPLTYKGDAPKPEPLPYTGGEVQPQPLPYTGGESASETLPYTDGGALPYPLKEEDLEALREQRAWDEASDEALESTEETE